MRQYFLTLLLESRVVGVALLMAGGTVVLMNDRKRYPGAVMWVVVFAFYTTAFHCMVRAHLFSMKPICAF
jgi:hypothetical protein